MNEVTLIGKSVNVTVGSNHPIVVNCNFGINSKSEYNAEISKIDSIFSNIYCRPDLVMDLSLVGWEFPIANYISNKYGIPVGIVPIYAINESSITDEIILQRIELLASRGVAFMTMHFTADADLYEEALHSREIPSTSRGGMITLKYSLKRGSKINFFRRNMYEIVAIATKYDMAISLGSTFRPAGMCDACDDVHIRETKRQIELAHKLTSLGCKVMIENIGHIRLDILEKHCKLLKKAFVPIMPLGPLPLDSSIGNDHITSAIGASFMGYYDALHIINVVTPSEHLKDKFTLQDSINGITAAKIAAKSINCIRFQDINATENDIYHERARAHRCMIGQNECNRCGDVCPLIIKRNA